MDRVQDVFRRERRRRIQRVLFLVLVGVTIGFAVTTYYAHVGHAQAREELPPYMDDWRTLWQAQPAYLYGACLLALAWALFAMYVAGPGLRELFAAGLLLLASVAPVMTVRAVEPVHVDLWVVADEEFDAGTIWVPLVPGGPIPVPSKSWAEANMEWVAEEYGDVFQLELHWHWWTDFDSDDGNGDIEALLYEAKRELGWRWGREVDGEPMELMVVFTQQAMDRQGFSPPYERILVVVQCFDIDCVLSHELGHQFGLGHCPYDTCYMWNGYVGNMVHYCASHQAALMANREVLHEPPPDPPLPGPPAVFYGGGGGGGRPTIRSTLR
jgi:hypothetical protein